MSLPESYYCPNELCTTGFKVFWDPLVQLPLDERTEKMISSIGPRAYLAGMMRWVELTLSAPIETLTEWECEQIIRAVVRGTEDYAGHEKCH